MDNGRSTTNEPIGEKMPFFTAGSGAENANLAEITPDTSNPNLSLEGWTPDRNPRAMGSKVSEAFMTPAKGQPSELGTITDLPDSPISTDVRPASPIPLTWSSDDQISASTVHEIKAREQQLAASGDIGAFYRDFRASAEAASGQLTPGGHA